MVNGSMRLMRSAAVLVALAISSLRTSHAQEPDRPALPKGADPSDWESYFDLGVQKFKRTPLAAEEAFYWSSRLDPTRAEPLFARYAAFFAHTKDQDVTAYFRDDKEILQKPEFRTADSLRALALLRNPFVHRGLEILIFERIYGKFAVDRDTRAWVAYSNGEFLKAIELYSATIGRGGRDARWRRFDRALAYAAMDDYKNSLSDLRAVLAELRADEQRGAVRFYRSKHFVLYMIGTLHAAMRDSANARRAFQEALLEDASFAYGNAGLASVSRVQRNNVQAADEYSLAVELAPNDPVLHFLRAQVLFDLNRHADAEQDLTRAMELEPHWAAPLYLLGRVREKQDRPEDALAVYTRFVQMAPRNDLQAHSLRARGIVK